MLPEWAGSYSTLGVFYYQTGQIEKAREVLDRFKGSNAGGLDVGRIEQALAQGPGEFGRRRINRCQWRLASKCCNSRCSIADRSL